MPPMQKSRSFDLAKNIRLIGLIFAAPSPFKDTCAKKKVRLLEFQDIHFKKLWRFALGSTFGPRRSHVFHNEADTSQIIMNVCFLSKTVHFTNNLLKKKQYAYKFFLLQWIFRLFVNYRLVHFPFYDMRHCYKMDQ